MRAVVVVVGAGLVGALGVGCELLVQLDRSAVTVAEAGCPICSDVTEEGDDSGTDAQARETGDDAVDTDAGTEGSTDAGTPEQ
ncbi:MAG TPA: hypothetical protein VGL81_01185 [Polyangiaceae bacterium]